MKFFSLLFVVIQCFTLYPVTYLTTLTSKNCTLIKKFESTNSYLGLIKVGKFFYIVRQKKNKEKGKGKWSVLLSTMASVVAESIRDILLSQKVWIIPSTLNFPGKYYSYSVASLHSLVSGKQVKEWQKDIAAPASVKVLLDNFSVRLESGLTEKVISCMTRHDDLPCIVAYCFLLGYKGCHNLNIFYDYELDRFLLIDMDSCFKYKNFQQAYEMLLSQTYKFLTAFFKKHEKRDIQITKKQQSALLKFADSLELIMERNPRTKIKAIISDIYNDLKESKSTLEDNVLLNKMANIEPTLQKGYFWAKKIILLIRATFK